MNAIPSVEDFLSRNSTQLSNTILDPCPRCGRKHPVPFEDILVGPGVLKHIPLLAEGIVGHKPRRAVLIYDQAIEAVIQAGVIEPLRSGGLARGTLPHARRARPPAGFWRSQRRRGRRGHRPIRRPVHRCGLRGDQRPDQVDRHDLGKPFILCGTAPSMNGYTSITATMTENKIKISKFLNPANAVVMDVDIVKDAPMAMIHAGIGDLAARAICNADWKLSELMRGTYFCPLPFEMTAENERRYLAAAAGIARRDPASIELLSEAILLSGLSMTVLEGETSPSSGAEHVLSHFWDFLAVMRGIEKNFHGAQVGVGTILLLNAYQYLREVDPDKIDPRRVLRSRPSLEDIQAENAALYGEKGAAFDAVARQKRIPDAELVPYLQNILMHWEDTWRALQPYVAPVDRIRGPFERAGVPYSLASIHRTRDQAREALLHGSHYRPRYTILDLLWELGLFPQAADEILERSGVL